MYERVVSRRAEVVVTREMDLVNHGPLGRTQRRAI